MPNELLISNRIAVLKYYERNENDIRTCIDHIREWLQKQTHLPKISDKRIEFILIRSKFSLERTKQILETHYSIRTIIPELFTNWDILSSQLKLATSTIMFAPLRKLTSNLDRISVLKFLDPNPERFVPWEFYKLTFLIGELRIENECNVGEQIFYDLEGTTLTHILKITPSIVKKIEIVAKKAYALKLNGIHFLNYPPAIDKLMVVFKSVLKPKLFNRIYLHKNLESIHKVLPKEMLPRDYGGDEPSLIEIYGKWLEKLEANRFKLINESKRIATESKYLDELNDSVFGSIHGSFRKLQID